MAKKKKKKIAHVVREPTTSERTREFFLKRQHAIAVFLISLIGFEVYARTFRVPFIYDDLPLIRDNPALTGFHFSQFPTSLGATRQIGFLSFSLSYMLTGTNVFGYHVINLLIHLINAVLSTLPPPASDVRLHFIYIKSDKR